MGKQRYKYLVGYRGDGNHVFGKNYLKGLEPHATTEPVTKNQAEQMVKKMSVPGKAVIYKLVEVPHA